MVAICILRIVPTFNKIYFVNIRSNWMQGKMFLNFEILNFCFLLIFCHAFRLPLFRQNISSFWPSNNERLIRSEYTYGIWSFLNLMEMKRWNQLLMKTINFLSNDKHVSVTYFISHFEYSFVLFWQCNLLQNTQTIFGVNLNFHQIFHRILVCN